jgi:U3 small nucleolar RNA-associated protein 5
MNKSLCAFGPGQEHTHYVAITPDNRVRLFDTTSGGMLQELAEQTHLAITYTSLAWSSKKSNNGTSTKRKREHTNGAGSEDSSPGLLALGNDKGHIVVWDLAVGRVVQKLSGHSSAVTSLTFGMNGETLFSGAAGDKIISQWNTSTGKRVSEINVGKRGTTWLAVSPDGATLLVASSTMRLYDLASNTKLDKFGKYTQQVRHASFSPSGQFIFSIAPDRISSVYRRIENTASTSSVMPVHNFALPTLPTGMHLQQMEDNSNDGSSEIFHFLSTSEDGAIYVWRWNAKAESKRKKRKGSKATSNDIATVSPDGSSKSNSRIIRARFVGDRILIAAGDLLSPLFAFVEYLDHDQDEIGAVKKHVGVPSAAETLSMMPADGKKNGDVRVTKQTEEAHVGTAVSVGSATPVWPEPKSKRQRADGGDGEGNGDGDGSDEEEEEEEMALMDRVQELEEQLDRSMTTTTLSADANGSGDSISETVTNKNSLIQVLQQALHGNDDALLEHCLGTTNVAIIDSTVEGMTPAFVIPFLTRVVAKFEARPARGRLLAVWIHAVIGKHASYIVSTPTVLKTLSGLHETIDARLGAFKRLLKLSGRLDLVLSQMTLMQNQKRRDDQSGSNGGQVVARSSFVDNS